MPRDTSLSDSQYEIFQKSESRPILLGTKSTHIKHFRCEHFQQPKSKEYANLYIFSDIHFRVKRVPRKKKELISLKWENTAMFHNEKHAKQSGKILLCFMMKNMRNWNFHNETATTTAVGEADVSRHLGGPINGSPETPTTSRQYDHEGLHETLNWIPMRFHFKHFLFVFNIICIGLFCFILRTWKGNDVSSRTKPNRF